MSFDVFVSCWKNKEPASLPQSEFRRLVAGNITHSSEGFVRAAFPDGAGDFFVDEGDAIQTLVANHLCGLGVMDAIVALAGATGAAIFWASAPPCLAVANASDASHLPDDIVGDLGPVVVVTNGRALLDAIEGGAGSMPTNAR